MNIEIISTPLHLNIFGCGGIATDKNYAGTVFKLSGKMWEIVKAKALRNKGKNIWVYEPDDKVFAGLELESDFQDNGHGLEKKKIIVEKYAYCKHVGPYHLIKQTGQRMTDQLNNQGLQVTLPYIEIYGHWSSDETKLETDLLMALK